MATKTATNTAATKTAKVKAIPTGYHAITPYLYAPTHFGGSPVSLLLYVTDVDAMFKQALGAGATEVRPVADQFYGDRSGTLKDPFGHTWHLSTHKGDVSMEEMARRMAAMKH